MNLIVLRGEFLPRRARRKGFSARTGGSHNSQNRAQQQEVDLAQA